MAPGLRASVLAVVPELHGSAGLEVGGGEDGGVEHHALRQPRVDVHLTCVGSKVGVVSGPPDGGLRQAVSEYLEHPEMGPGFPPCRTR